MYSKFKITQTASTVAALMGFDAPKGSAEINSVLYEKAKAALPDGVEHYDRALIYNPDAIAMWLYQKYTHLFKEAVACTDVQMSLTSMDPSITPVCFASLYTGLEPSAHGVDGFMWPVLTVETLFDTAARSGKKCAIISTVGDSLARLYLDREIDYYFLPTYPEVLAKALEVIEMDKYDFVAMYNKTYDATMHVHGPESSLAIDVLEQNCKDFSTIVDAIRTHWKGHNTFYGFCPDHGCHAVPPEEIDYQAKITDLGTHGTLEDSDMNVVSLFGTHIDQ